jgi:hypothetical protein
VVTDQIDAFDEQGILLKSGERIDADLIVTATNLDLLVLGGVARPVPPRDLVIMRRIDELHLERPFAGSRMSRDMLIREGPSIGRRHVASLMKRMGIAAIYRRPNTSKPAPGRKIHPYLLRGTKIDLPDQVRATEITYIPMARGAITCLSSGSGSP